MAWMPEEAASTRQQHTKGGFPTKKDAELAMPAFLATIDTGRVVLPTRVTVATTWPAGSTPSSRV